MTAIKLFNKLKCCLNIFSYCPEISLIRCSNRLSSQMELLDRFWPASRQLAKCGPARFGPDLSQAGSRIEVCPGDRSDESSGESQ